MHKELSPASVWREFLEGQSFHAQIGLEEEVKRNEDFFLGNQWEGVYAPDLDKPVFNILKRVVNYFIAMLVSDNIAVNLSLFNHKSDQTEQIVLKMLEQQVAQVMDYNRFGALCRHVLRDAAVDGDGCLHVYFDPEVETGDPLARGYILAECVDNTSVFFGNPQSADVQKQPYIIVAGRERLEDVRAQMRAHGSATEDLCADSAFNELLGEHAEGEKITVLTRYWRDESGSIRFMKTTQSAVIRPETESGLRLYPICWMNWERVKNRCHGVGVLHALLPNQMAINKLAALAQQFIKQQAFPRVFYNENKLKHWAGGIKPIAVQGDPKDIVYSDRHNTNMSVQVAQYMDKFISYTRDLMGASDAALGNVNPMNTSAIIAVQKSTAVPLELVRQSYYLFVEDFVRIALNQMRARFGTRTVLLRDESGIQQELPLDFSSLEGHVLNIRADVGQAAYWSELTATSTLDNLFQKQLVDPLTYLESIPSHLLPNKARLESELRRRLQAQQAAQAAAQSIAAQPMTAQGGMPDVMPQM